MGFWDSDWNPVNWPGDIVNGLTGTSGGLSGALGLGSNDPSNPDRSGLRGVASGAQGFATQAGNNYGADTAALQGTQQYLQGLMKGQNSVSAEQLRQSLQQQLAQQRAMAASAGPNNAAMAARNAAMNMGRASYGMAGQQALAGIAERNAAANALGQLQLGERGQDVQGAVGGYNAASGAYGAAVGNPQKTFGSLIGGGIGGLSAGLIKSDARAKKDVKDGGSDAMRALEKLRAKSYRYKDERDGKGKQFGVMAQDLESAGLGHAVIDTPNGKYVDAGKAATSALGLVAELHRRLSKLEGARK